MSEGNIPQYQKQFDEQFCSSCGKPIKIKAEICPYCGVRQYGSKEKSDRNWLTCLLLFLFLGWIGGHRFYVGKIWTAILYVITAYGIGIWALIDFISILTGNFKDNEGKFVR